MKLASIFYTIEALSSTIVPVINLMNLFHLYIKEEISAKDKKGELDLFNTNQLESLVTETFILNCFHAMTGIKFVLVTNLTTTEGNSLLKNVYEIYSDFVSKDPFYTVYMKNLKKNNNFL